MRSAMLLLAANVGLVRAALAAQAAQVCAAMPGVRFGITAFQCASCVIKQAEVGGRMTYTFLSEPVITETERASAFAPGDIIEAVDTLPITTQGGGDHFTYPVDGSHTVTVRRGQERHNVVIQLRGRCRVGSASPLDTVRRGNQLVVIDTSVHAGYGSGRGSREGRGVGVPVLGGEPMVIVNGLPVKVTGSQIGRFGFATECRPSCSTKRSASGRYVFVYDGYPVVAAVRAGSVAEAAGLRVDDEIIAINGRSILADDALQGTDSRDDLSLTVRRAGKEMSVTMRVTR